MKEMILSVFEENIRLLTEVQSRWTEILEASRTIADAFPGAASC